MIMEKIIEAIGAHSDIDTRLMIEHVTGIDLHKKLIVPRLKIPVTPYLFRHLPNQRLVIYIDALDYEFSIYSSIEPTPDGYWSPCYMSETWKNKSGEYIILGTSLIDPFMFAGQPEIISA